MYVALKLAAGSFYVAISKSWQLAVAVTKLTQLIVLLVYVAAIAMGVQFGPLIHCDRESSPARGSARRTSWISQLWSRSSPKWLQLMNAQRLETKALSAVDIR